MRLIDEEHGIDLTIRSGEKEVLALLRKAFPDIRVVEEESWDDADCVGESAYYAASGHGSSSRLLMCRKRRGLTQGALAERVGIKREALSMLENGKRNLGVNLAKKLAPALGVDYKDLLPDV